MPFPLPFIPKHDWHSGGRVFGADRANKTRKHAGCDLLAPEGTEIYAVADGYIHEASRHEFYHGTKAISVMHGSFLVRYCEVGRFADDFEHNEKVEAGQVIAFVGKMFTTSMLHFEVYAGTLHGPLTVRSNKQFQRRADLVDPTALLDRLARQVLRSQSPPTLVASADGVID